MKIINFVIFLTITLTIYGAANFYIFIRGWQSLPRELAFRVPYLVLFLVISLSYIAGRVLERFSICAASEVLIWIGSIWFGMMLYLFLGVLLCDLLRLANWLVHVIPVPSAASRQIAACVVPAVAAIAVLVGYVNALQPRVKTLDVDIPKSAGGRQALEIALVTDIHLGTIISNSRLQKMVELVNGLRTDLVLLGGDIVDEDLAPVIENNLGELLRAIRSRYGTYAVTGNHEFYGGVGKACRYLGEHGVTVLRDRAVLIDGSFYLVGRDDRAISQVSDKKRMPLGEIMKGVDRSLPVIMMDHQPLRLSEAAENGVDLQLSGHTHHAQLWPLHVVTRLIYEVSYGFKRIGGCGFYVSCGFGTWGPPVRLGVPSEIVHIRVRFGK